MLLVSPNSRNIRPVGDPIPCILAKTHEHVVLLYFGKASISLSRTDSL